MPDHGWALPKRKKFIQDLQTGANEGSYPLSKFQGKPVSLPFYKVPIGLPKYRLANGRTQAAQQEFLALHPDMPKEFFRSDFESDEAQAAQDHLLQGMVQEEGLLKYFKDPKNTQTDPLILTNDGFVVNGNRRLCAFRKLFAEDAQKFEHLQSIAAIILPVCVERDIDALEAELQIKKDIKAEYNWYTKACMFRSKRQAGAYTDEELANMYDLAVKEIQELIRLLEYAEKYLEAIGKPQQYHLVEDKYFAFKSLTSAQQKLTREGDKDLLEKVAFVLINSPEKEGRLYERIPQIQEYLPVIAGRLKEDLTMPAAPPAGAAQTGLDLLGGPAETTDTRLVKAVEADENKGKVYEVVQDVIQSETNKKREMKNKNFVLEKIRGANTLLADALSGISKDSNIEGIQAQLDAVTDGVARITKWIHDNA